MGLKKSVRQPKGERSRYNSDGPIRHLVGSGSGNCLTSSLRKPPGRELCATDQLGG